MLKWICSSKNKYSEKFYEKFNENIPKKKRKQIRSEFNGNIKSPLIGKEHVESFWGRLFGCCCSYLFTEIKLSSRDTILIVFYYNLHTDDT